MGETVAASPEELVQEFGAWLSVRLTAANAGRVTIWSGCHRENPESPWALSVAATVDGHRFARLYVCKDARQAMRLQDALGRRFPEFVHALTKVSQAVDGLLLAYCVGRAVDLLLFALPEEEEDVCLSDLR